MVSKKCWVPKNMDKKQNRFKFRKWKLGSYKIFVSNKAHIDLTTTLSLTEVWHWRSSLVNLVNTKTKYFFGTMAEFAKGSNGKDRGHRISCWNKSLSLDKSFSSGYIVSWGTLSLGAHCLLGTLSLGHIIYLGILSPVHII